METILHGAGWLSSTMVQGTQLLEITPGCPSPMRHVAVGLLKPSF